MPSDDYAPVVRGSLKLKGSTPSGITKKKKKKSKPSATDTESALQKTLAEEDAVNDDNVKQVGKKRDEEEGQREDDLRELETRDGDGKTASERQYEEMRRKRVSWAACAYGVLHKCLLY